MLSFKVKPYSLCYEEKDYPKCLHCTTFLCENVLLLTSKSYLDEDVLLTTEEVDFALSVAVFPRADRGLPGQVPLLGRQPQLLGLHLQVDQRLLHRPHGAAFYHRYYHFLYTHFLSHLLHKIVDQSQNCEDILLNFLVSHVTRLPPSKSPSASSTRRRCSRVGVAATLPLERPRPLRPAADLHQQLRQGLRVHAPGSVQHSPGPRPIQRPGFQSQEEVPPHGDRWQLVKIW
ncbi:exostosin-1b [Caerostris extrusa]|uniref:Exostosin-1b n=1 Tax=Caerostris extrusa TaxID=172846 RepID=A0AAV4N0W9_CAEEX|nr:exostosin-1b [Caerostris extrusa]